MKKNRPSSKRKTQRINSRKLSSDQLEECTRVLKQGGLIIFPTDTFYGLGAMVNHSSAVDRIYDLKGRDRSNPLSVVVFNVEMAMSLVTGASPEARCLMDEFWPGPLTLMLPARSDYSSFAVSKEGRIGIRIPDHPLTLTLLQHCGFPITATSANKTGGENPVTAGEAADSLEAEVDLILDAGPVPGGLESTIVDTTLNPPRLIREGKIPFSLVMDRLGITLTDQHDW